MQIRSMASIPGFVKNLEGVVSLPKQTGSLQYGGTLPYHVMQYSMKRNRTHVVVGYNAHGLFQSQPSDLAFKF